ncbi:spindle pole body component 97-like [Dermacentor silvarum]|uniref:spindle pole body component 97-like n=1 Tax=Dermacentor silvarum TaxID=543639 RepID=UPI00210192C9|nr:spindle pole body component 97-like [Dermacentor silvarum]
MVEAVVDSFQKPWQSLSGESLVQLEQEELQQQVMKQSLKKPPQQQQQLLHMLQSPLQESREQQQELQQQQQQEEELQQILRDLLMEQTTQQGGVLQDRLRLLDVGEALLRLMPQEQADRLDDILRGYGLLSADGQCFAFANVSWTDCNNLIRRRVVRRSAESRASGERVPIGALVVASPSTLRPTHVDNSGLLFSDEADRPSTGSDDLRSWNHTVKS